MPPKRVLIVEDHDTTRWGVGQELSKGGYEVDIASNTQEACDALDQREYDVILSDLVMPGDVNGLEFGEILRQAGTNAITIAMSSLDAAQQCANAGYSYFLSKPFSRDDLLKAISDATSNLPN